MPNAAPATARPTVDALTRFQNMHSGPQLGTASEKNVTGSITRNPHSGPRSHQRCGHEDTPTQKPMNSRAR